MTPSSSNIAGLPLGISFSNGSSVSYGYGFTRDTIYENGTARMLLHEEGYLDLSTGGSNPPSRFFVKDHLGSVRAVVSAGGAIQESTDYYPLGGMFNAGMSIQPHKFSGKEWDSFSGLNTFDFGARTYDPYTGRWLTQDPLAEKYFSHSPYVYCAGNPVRYVDPDGRVVIPNGTRELNTILNTIPEDARQYTTLNKSGEIDGDVMQKVPITVDYWKWFSLRE